MSEKNFEKIKKIVLEITTCTDKKSGTDNTIELYIGGHTWVLDIPKYDDFERGKTDSYNLDVPANMDVSWFRYLCFRKRVSAGREDDWCIAKIKLMINDKIVYQKDNLKAWLKDNQTSWCAPGFTYGKAGE